MIVPPVALGSSFLSLSLLLGALCLLGVLFIAVGAARAGRHRVAYPALYGLLALTLILAAVNLWRDVG